MAESNSGRSVNNGDSGLYSYDSFNGSKKQDTHHFLWWCAGAHQKLLKEFPSEHSKYSGLGGVILATFILAALSAGYAFYSIFGSWVSTIAFAIIWGLIIFNFDRFLVSTMRKYGISKRKQVWMALPRMALAILIGLTIARPLELKIFEKEIAVKMTENLHKKIQRNDSLLQLEYKGLLQSAGEQRMLQASRKMALEDTLHWLQAAYLQEADGTGGSGQRGIRGLTQLKMDAYREALLRFGPELTDLTGGLKKSDSLATTARAGLEEKRKQYEASLKDSQGFLERNKALSDLSDEESSVFLSGLLISLLIILIEVGPVLSKLIMPVGPYDLALAKEELIQMAADENAMREDKEIKNEKRKMFFRKQMEMSDELVDKLTNLQRRNIDEELEKWEKGEWDPKDHRASMDEVMRKIKLQYQFRDEDIL